MLENIFVGIMVIIVVVASVYGWRSENSRNHDDKHDDKKDNPGKKY